MSRITDFLSTYTRSLNNMKTAKRNIIILTALIMSTPVIFVLQHQHISKVNSQITEKANLQNLQEEIEIIKEVTRDILQNIKPEIEILNQAIDDNQISIPANLRDPFIFPEDILKTQAQKLITENKLNVTNKKTAKKPEKPKLEFKLTGIIFDRENPMAIINGDIFKVSDKIAEYTIKAINEQGVRLVSPKESIFLKAPVIE